MGGSVNHPQISQISQIYLLAENWLQICGIKVDDFSVSWSAWSGEIFQFPQRDRLRSRKLRESKKYYNLDRQN